MPAAPTAPVCVVKWFFMYILAPQQHNECTVLLAPLQPCNVGHVSPSVTLFPSSDFTMLLSPPTLKRGNQLDVVTKRNFPSYYLSVTPLY